MKKQPLKVALRVANEVAGIAAQISGKMSPMGVAIMAVRAADTAVRLHDMHTPAPNPVQDWYAVDCPMFQLIAPLLESRRTYRVLRVDQQDPNAPGVRHCVDNLYGVKIVWASYERWSDGPWCKDAEDREKARDALARFVWEHYGAAISFSLHRSKIQLTRDLLTDALPSRLSEDLAAKTAKYLDAGHSRCILLYGEPGAGKSHIIRDVAARLGGHTLRLTPDALADFNPTHIIDFLAPRTVIIDDLERFDRPGEMLKYFEQVKSSTRLMMFSVNDLSGLDRAVLRPGRIDDIIEIKNLDEEIVEILLTGASESTRKRLERLPVAYLSHYSITAQVLGEDAAIEEVEALHARSEMIRNA